eukprot:Hpha_TRINITY_DN11333_c0_g1::TRINITY_DN11333_c0_g1_i1::g.62991::m.62991
MDEASDDSPTVDECSPLLGFPDGAGELRRQIRGGESEPRTRTPSPPPQPPSDTDLQAHALREALEAKEGVLAALRAKLNAHGEAATVLSRLVSGQRDAAAQLRQEVDEFERGGVPRCTSKDLQRVRAERAAAEQRLSELRAELDETNRRGAARLAAARQSAAAAARAVEVRRAEALGEHEERLAADVTRLRTTLAETIAAVAAQLAERLDSLRSRADFLQQQLERKQEEVDGLAARHEELRSAAVHTPCSPQSLSLTAARQSRRRNAEEARRLEEREVAQLRAEISHAATHASRSPQSKQSRRDRTRARREEAEEARKVREREAAQLRAELSQRVAAAGGQRAGKPLTR